jgi:hypothetical protein
MGNRVNSGRISPDQTVDNKIVDANKEDTTLIQTLMQIRVECILARVGEGSSGGTSSTESTESLNNAIQLYETNYSTLVTKNWVNVSKNDSPCEYSNVSKSGSLREYSNEAENNLEPRQKFNKLQYAIEEEMLYHDLNHNITLPYSARKELIQGKLAEGFTCQHTIFCNEHSNRFTIGAVGKCTSCGGYAAVEGDKYCGKCALKHYACADCGKLGLKIVLRGN